MMAARVTDLTAHGGMISGPGAPNVLIGKLPACRMGDMHMCPMVTPGMPPVPHLGGPIVGGCPTVLISGRPAARQGDMCVCAGPPSSIVLGCPTVFIGSGGVGGGGGGNSSSSPEAKVAQELKSGKIKPVEGTETYPIEIQAIAYVLQNYCTHEGEQVDMKLIDTLAQEHERKEKEKEQYKELTISDFADILKNLEQKSGYETARHFAGHLNYGVLCEKTKAFVTGEDTDSQNDPNLMPTKYMLLYGADDDKLQEISDHPDINGHDEHKITVANLRRALILQGAKIDATGIYDDKVFDAYCNYYFQFMKKINGGLTHTVACGEDLGSIARMYMLSSWKYLYDYNKDIIGDNPDLLAEGTELNIPQWDATEGDEMIAEKGGKIDKYIGGIIWRYPWQSISISFMDDIKKGLLPDFDDERRFKLVVEDSNETILAGTIKRCDELDVIIPDLVKVKPFVEGLTIKKISQ